MYLKHRSLLTASLLILTLSTSIHANKSPQNAPVSGFAREFMLNTPLKNGSITILETGERLQTNDKGEFGPILYPVGKPITLVFEKWSYPTFQSGTMIVPKQGLNTEHNNITFQIPNIAMFQLLKLFLGAKFNDNACHVATTITAFNKTLDDVPQGIAGAKVTLTPKVNETPYYFGIFASGPFKGYTSPFAKGLTETTEDGGVAFFNLPPRNEPYKISASKNGVKFSEAAFICKKGAFVNISPPLGPKVL